MIYDIGQGLVTMQWVFKTNSPVELGVEDYEIRWDALVDKNHKLIIVGVVYLEKCGHKFLVRWGRCLRA